MVGVGGRSKACDRCRLRRVKCDLTSPECKRCLKAGLKCGGYRGLSILQYDGKSGRAVLSNGSPGSSVTAATPSVSVTGSLRNTKTGEPWNLYQPQTPHDEVFVTYTQSRLLRGSEEIAVALVSGTSSRLTNQCFVALSMTYFGIEHMEHDILRRGLYRYGKSLKVLNETLSDPSASRTLDVLEAIVVMTFFEYLIGDRENGWINHSRGLERLLEIRGPESMTSLPCLMLLERARPTIIFSAIILHQPTILSVDEWKSHPWIENPGRKDAMQFLIDILADCPELFAFREAISTDLDEDSRRSAICQLQQKARKVLNDLRLWKQNTFETLNGWIEVPSPPTVPKTANWEGRPTPIWEIVFHFQSLHQANILALYHSTLSLVLKFYLDIQLALNESEDCERIKASIHAAGIAICRSVDYHIERIHDGAGSFFILFPLRIAFDAVGANNPEIGLWLKEILKRISSGSAGRWATAQYLLDIRPSSDHPTPTHTPSISTPTYT